MVTKIKSIQYSVSSRLYDWCDFYIDYNHNKTNQQKQRDRKRRNSFYYLTRSKIGINCEKDEIKHKKVQEERKERRREENTEIQKRLVFVYAQAKNSTKCQAIEAACMRVCTYTDVCVYPMSICGQFQIIVFVFVRLKTYIRTERFIWSNKLKAKQRNSSSSDTMRNRERKGEIE